MLILFLIFISNLTKCLRLEILGVKRNGRVEPLIQIDNSGIVFLLMISKEWNLLKKMMVSFSCFGKILLITMIWLISAKLMTMPVFQAYKQNSIVKEEKSFNLKQTEET